MLTYNHLVYVIHNVVCWERNYSPKRLTVKSVAKACERYDGNYSAFEYEEAMRQYGFKKVIAKAKGE